MSPQKKDKLFNEPLTLVVVGASGNLAQYKVLPALFALYSNDLLPDDFRVVGYARKSFSHDEFRKATEEHLTCRYVPDQSCEEIMANFLKRCFYVSGQYDKADDFQRLKSVLSDVGGGRPANHIFYLATPPFLFSVVANSLKEAGLSQSASDSGCYTRVVIEKPFGRDRMSSDELTENLLAVFDEEQTYRIDHYLGKEVVQNLNVLRFANQVFRPMWSAEWIKYVTITFEEDFGVEGRGGYFDEYGIIRDVIQNHLLQIMALIAMDIPKSLGAEDVRDAKVEILKQVRPVGLDDLAVGQYAQTRQKGWIHPAYVDEDTVPADSLAPTFAAVVLEVDNAQWKGVPFLLVAGKGMGRRASEIRIGLSKAHSHKLYEAEGHVFPRNELVIRIQPDESIYMNIINKVPGFGMDLAPCELDLSYQSTFKEVLPEAYESLLLDVVRGDKSLFIRSDELSAAWDIFTPVLHEMEEKKIQPDPYPFGSIGTDRCLELVKHYDIDYQSDGSKE